MNFYHFSLLFYIFCTKKCKITVTLGHGFHFSWLFLKPIYLRAIQYIFVSHVLLALFLYEWVQTSALKLRNSNTCQQKWLELWLNFSCAYHKLMTVLHRFRYNLASLCLFALLPLCHASVSRDTFPRQSSLPISAMAVTRGVTKVKGTRKGRMIFNFPFFTWSRMHTFWHWKLTRIANQS